MNKSRATELLAESINADFRAGCLNYGGPPKPEPITPEERQEVLDKWKTMPGHTCFNDALREIINGTENQSEQPKISTAQRSSYKSCERAVDSRLDDEAV